MRIVDKLNLRVLKIYVKYLRIKIRSNTDLDQTNNFCISISILPRGLILTKDNLTYKYVLNYLTIADESVATITKQNKADQSPIHSRIVRYSSSYELNINQSNFFLSFCKNCVKLNIT